jgi:hypothetical protein
LLLCVIVSSILNITNGDSAVAIMREAGLGGDFLPWRDVLHVGPVPAGLSLEELSRLRAEFLSTKGWGEFEAIQRDFMQRDEMLKRFHEYDKVLLWFEHDLYDQLQILQILNWLHSHHDGRTPLSMICTDQYLGMLDAQQMAHHRQHEQAITNAQLELASSAWLAFRQPTPLPLVALCEGDCRALPFLHSALLRLLEEYPACSHGLSRSMHQALAILATGDTNPARVFARLQQCEEARFMGDTVFWDILNEMIEADQPLLAISNSQPVTRPQSREQLLRLTQTGRRVLDGAQNWLDLDPPARWIGGVRLDDETTWCRDSLDPTRLQQRDGSLNRA